MLNIPDLDKFISNFILCKTWEEKYLYIIELGEYIFFLPKNIRHNINLMQGCQSKIWIMIYINNKGKFIFLGDSNTSITRGLITIILIFYKNMNIFEIINYDINFFFDKLCIKHHLSQNRSYSLDIIIKNLIYKSSLYIKKILI
ncbi:MAG: SufE family protein [Candidatus Makana argininalis]